MDRKISAIRFVFVSIIFCLYILLITSCSGSQEVVYVVQTVEVPITVNEPIQENPIEESPQSTKEPESLPESTEVPLEEPTQTKVQVKKNRIVLHGIRYTVTNSGDDYFSDEDFTKFAALAFTKGLKLSVPTRSFPEELLSPDVAAAILIGSESAEDILAIDAFVKSGGTAIILYSRDWVDYNELLQDIFGVSVVQEMVLSVDNTLIVPPAVLPPELREYQVGMVHDDRELRIRAYLVTNQGNAGGGLIPSKETGKDRLVYYPSDSLIFMPAIHSYTDSYSSIYRHKTHYTPFFGDTMYDYFDNELAANALLDVLINSE